MSMSSQTTVATETLRRLHRVHQQLRDLKDRLDRGPRIAKAHADHVARLETQLEEARAKVKGLRLSVDDKQLQLKGREDAVNRRKQQLREAKSNKEFQALKEQIAADEMTNSVLADEILEGMERLDEAVAKAKAAEETLAKGRQDAQKVQEETDRQTPVLQGDLVRLTGELQQAEADLPPDFRDVYQRLIRSKGSDGLAPIVGEFCGGCNQHVPLNMVNALKLAKPIFCRSCGRLLYLPEEG